MGGWDPPCHKVVTRLLKILDASEKVVTIPVTTLSGVAQPIRTSWYGEIVDLETSLYMYITVLGFSGLLYSMSILNKPTVSFVCSLETFGKLACTCLVTSHARVAGSPC